MAICKKLVETGGFGTAFPCGLGLPEGHEGPCAAEEKPASVTARKQWLDARILADQALKTPDQAVKAPDVDMSVYIEPRPAVEFVVDKDSISPVPQPRRQAPHIPPYEPTPVAPRPVAPPPLPEPRPADAGADVALDEPMSVLAILGQAVVVLSTLKSGLHDLSPREVEQALDSMAASLALLIHTIEG